MRPILIDALHINMGGGLMILNHLINNLVKRDVDFVLLKDERCPDLESENKIKKLLILSPKHKSRKNFYKIHKNNFSKVVCLGNIPPTIKLEVPIYTYFHNVNLLKIPKGLPLNKKISRILKRLYIKRYVHNTDAWVVQTSYTASLVKKILSLKNQPVYEFPFYWIPSDINRNPKSKRTDYVFIGDYTLSKGHDYLLAAWEKLGNVGIRANLHLTVSKPEFIKLIEDAIKRGTHVTNHGKIPFSEVINLYNISKATVYPSLNESLGLGIVEAVTAGCDVIGVDLPYIHSICKPVKCFKASDIDSIVNAVIEYENHNTCQLTELTIQDMVAEFINFITSNYSLSANRL